MSRAPYLLLSDLHYHPWSAFSSEVDGVNSRLQIILNETQAAAEALRAAGGSKIILAGDVFHVRGSVAPSVLNPVMDLYRKLIADGFEIYGIPGNHDLEGNESARVGNAVTALESVGVQIAHTPTTIQIDSSWRVALFPWFSTVAALMAEMRDTIKRANMTRDYKVIDAVIHAPIDRVLPHLPDHGFKADELSSLGYRNVFAGHYHHHLDMGGVYSIGALTHQTWGDVGTRAGYVLVYKDRVEQFESGAPKFVELTGSEAPSELPEIIGGNYVRVRAEISSESELQELRDQINGYGAAGVVIQPIRKAVITRGAAPSSGAGMSIEASIEAFVAKNSMLSAVQSNCLDILAEARGAE